MKPHEVKVEFVDEVLLGITKAGMLAFVVAGMASMGLKLTVASILRPLRNPRVLIGILVANFVIVPGVMILAAKLLPVGEATGTAMILMGCCAGAPFLPTLAKLAHADQATAVGAMVMLMVLTVAYAPIVVPLVIEGASVSAWDIASSLIVLMLIPLLVCLAIRARYPEPAQEWAGHLGQISTGGLVLALAAALLVGWRNIWDSVGSGIFIATVGVVVVGLAAGFLTAMGADHTVLAFAAAQRNIAAALVVASSLGGDVIVRTLVGALLLTILLILLAAEVGKRSGAATGAAKAA